MLLNGIFNINPMISKGYKYMQVLHFKFIRVHLIVYIEIQYCIDINKLYIIESSLNHISDI